MPPLQLTARMVTESSIRSAYSLIGAAVLLFGVVSSHAIPTSRWGYLALLFSLPFLVAGAKWSQPRRLVEGGLFRWTIWTYVVTAFITYEAGAATTRPSDVMGTGFALVFAAALLLPVSLTWLIVFASRFHELLRRERAFAVLLSACTLAYLLLLGFVFLWASPIA